MRKNRLTIIKRKNKCTGIISLKQRQISSHYKQGEALSYGTNSTMKSSHGKMFSLTSHHAIWAHEIKFMKVPSFS
jgi:hypothetical protein